MELVPAAIVAKDTEGTFMESTLNIAMAAMDTHGHACKQSNDIRVHDLCIASVSQV